MSFEYKHLEIEKKWQSFWRENKTFSVTEDLEKPKYYILDMFPYPSGAGLHVGHPEGYTATDIVARYKRMRGFNVLHPMGWDAFGLPAERSAVREGRHPAEITKRNIQNFRRQIESLGLSYDWEREVCTSDPDYYKWTQWIFLKMYEKGLAYLDDVAVNWCPAQGTVLANEEVVDGKYVETGDPVERRMMKQWMFKITDYAEALLDGLDDLDWPKNVIEMQKNWIGKSVGAELNFKVFGEDNLSIKVFTTRPETIYGATFCVLSPDHDLVDSLTISENLEAVKKYREESKKLSERERDARSGKEKSGVFTGRFVIHPLTGHKMSVWIADYVKADYGSGAIMAVPSEDERDEDFAKEYSLSVVEIINSDNIMMNSGPLNGMAPDDARNVILGLIEEEKMGKAKTTYKLRDWLFSRQRYWGEPFPIMYGDDGAPVPASESDLPILLPEIEEFRPTDSGEPPLGRAERDWREVEVNGKKFNRELNTMPQWAGSCWYYLRYMDPRNTLQPFSPEKEKYWGQVDLYVGGLEHAVSHLLYSRFWHKVLFDCGIVSNKEPFKKLFNQGMILGISYRDAKGKYYHFDDVISKDGAFYSKEGGLPLTSMVEKMSKSKLNVINPDDIVTGYGADSLRLYEMFMGPLESTKSWQVNGVKGVSSFLHRVWRMSIDQESGELSSFVSGDDNEVEEFIVRELNVTIAKVTEDIEALKFNTAIAKMMEFTNACKKATKVSKEVWSKFILILSPFAPHIAEEIWQKLGGPSETIAYRNWPDFDEKYMVEEKVDVVLCINGKKVDVASVKKGLTDPEKESIFLNNEKIHRKLADKKIKKMIFVQDKLINAIVG